MLNPVDANETYIGGLRKNKSPSPEPFAAPRSLASARFADCIESWPQYRLAALAQITDSGAGCTKSVRVLRRRDAHDSPRQPQERLLKPDIRDPQLNPLYAELLDHYGVVPLPCQPYAHDLKGKVESAVGYTQGTELKGTRFESVEDENAHLFQGQKRA